MRKIYLFIVMALLMSGTLVVRAQMSDADIQKMTEASFAAFKANKWASFENGKYWGWQTKDGTGYRYYWEQALCTMATEQQAEYGTSADAKNMVIQNLDGFAIKYGTGMGLGWNDYIDDIGWVLDAYAVGYRITGKAEYLKYAKLLWNVGFIRGNYGPYRAVANKVKDGSEGLWWRVKHTRYSGYDAEGLNGKEAEGEVNKNQDHYKSPLAISPHVSAGAYLYHFTGDKHFLDGAIKLWQWEVNWLWVKDDDSGIYEGYDPYRAEIVDKDGNTQAERKEGFRTRRTMHDLSSFFEATNALWKVTGDQVYLAYCWKIINSVLNYRLDSDKAIQNAFSARDGSWCWEAGRAWTMFCADNNLWDFKGQIPLYEGTYKDYTGQTKNYTSKVVGKLQSIPNNWTLYQFMANSAAKIKDNNGTCIILPTNKNVKNPWGDDAIPAWGDVIEAEANDGKASKWFDVASSGMNIKASDNAGASGGKHVGYVGKGNYVELYYTPKESGIYDLDVAYATNATRTLDIDLNGKKLTTLTCDPTGSWTTMSRQTVTGLPLVKGNTYTIKLYNNTGDAPNIDCGVFVMQQQLDNIENMYYVKNVGQQKFIKTDKAAGYDMPGLVAQNEATPQVLTEQNGGTYLIASSDFAAGWGVQGRNTIYVSNNGSVKTNSWGTSITPGWQLVKTGQKENGYDVVYITYKWGDYAKGSVNVTDPSNKTFVLHYGAYDLSTDGWNDTQKADVALPWVYGGLESNLQNYGNNAKWVLIPLTSDRVLNTDSNDRTDNTVDKLTAKSSQKIEAENGTFKQPTGDMAGRPDAIKAVSGSAYSNGKKITNFGGLNWAEYTINVAEAGEYQIIVSYGIANNSFVEVDIDGVKKNIAVTSTGSKDKMAESRPVQFTLTKGSHLVTLSYSDDEGADLDYFLVNYTPETVQPQEPETPPVVEPGYETYTMSDFGVGTYSSLHNLDFFGISGLSAYIASGYDGASGAILMTRVNEVPAGTGVMLKGKAGTYKVPVVDENDWALKNLFVAVPTATTIAATASNGYLNYYYSNSGGNGAGFYRVSSTLSVGANRAYLSVPASVVNGARVLNVIFDDEITGVVDINRDAAAKGQYFDLQGRRIAQPAKGLYIQNGKKLIVK